MICPINPDRLTELCEAERRMKFLEAYAADRGVVLTDFGGANRVLAGKSFGVFSAMVDGLMLQFPELCEEITEVQVDRS